MSLYIWNHFRTRPMPYEQEAPTGNTAARRVSAKKYSCCNPPHIFLPILSALCHNAALCLVADVVLCPCLLCCLLKKLAPLSPKNFAKQASHRQRRRRENIGGEGQGVRGHASPPDVRVNNQENANEIAVGWRKDSREGAKARS
ncbi:hypothetical protein Pla52n_61360 [Stieleria varia]|uniref:Uncharacterized protein n=1 Tax=Stieleria varia TaxID=2528005 RepID=A0A5C6A0F4_9BACT|nr:hypothetical protein Pla52n_61360 [Stieleria varia]